MRLDTARGNFNFAEPLTFSSLLTQFLQGSGIPNPVAFTDARTHFNPIINLGRIEESNFRVRMFCWATTGSCERAADAAPISVSQLLSFLLPFFLSIRQVEFVEDNDPSYGTSAIRTAMIDEGKINFKTCFSKVLIPASYIIRLAIQNSSLDSHIFQRAVDHWLLCEVLNAIGNHTVAWLVPFTFSIRSDLFRQKLLCAWYCYYHRLRAISVLMFGKHFSWTSCPPPLGKTSLSYFLRLVNFFAIQLNFLLWSGLLS